jgi:hypothetical protein
MNKQELLKQADYNFQRGNRALAKKYLLDILTAYPEDVPAWMLLARVHEEKERKIECYERVLKINAQNNEARIGLIRVRSVSPPTLPLQSAVPENPWQVNNPARSAGSLLRGITITIAAILALGTTTFVVAKNNPESTVAKLFLAATPTPFAQALPDDIAAQTRAEVGAEYPQYAAVLDALISLAVQSAEDGMEGAPERPGAEIVPFEGAGEEARASLENALPQPGALTSVTLNEQQITSLLAIELSNNPDLPLSDIQVYLRDDRIQIWGMVNGTTDSTSALILGTLAIGSGNMLNVEIESVQIGDQVIPGLLVSQGESWINEALTTQINSQLPGLEIMNINISSGLITISGMR